MISTYPEPSDGQSRKEASSEIAVVQVLLWGCFGQGSYSSISSRLKDMHAKFGIFWKKIRNV
jgi:hypothetical protein